MVLLLPILQEISEFFCVILESLKSIFSKIIVKNNIAMEEMKISDEEINTNAIGFEIPSICEEECCEEEKLKHKIGF